MNDARRLCPGNIARLAAMILAYGWQACFHRRMN